MRPPFQLKPQDNPPPGRWLPGTPPTCGLCRSHLSRRRASALARPPLAYRPALSEWLPGTLVNQLRRRLVASDYHLRLAALHACVADAMPGIAALHAILPCPAAPTLALGGNRLLACWQALFLDGTPSLRQCRNFARRATELLACGRRLRDALQCFDGLARDVRRMLQQDAGGTAELQAVGTMAERLLAWGDALCDDEMSDEVVLRVRQYPQLRETFVQRAQDERRCRLGMDSLLALGEADLLRLDWTGGQRCALLKTLSRLGYARGQLRQHLLRSKDAQSASVALPRAAAQWRHD